ncbi:hypothetical protein BC777_3507 [Yoonia maricola]|uniref:Imelysin-like domain-containing protein n=1 Tax=Yoonia maricola TaxID=420999 RepID=A0A2M8W0K6_9RHOB|nr:imelysin family protein [Yoonia maricola]PJI84448.1 hypothetical protein BC777_3507 [Yoonia maricola]
MKNLLATIALMICPSLAVSQSIATDVVENHILPRIATLAESGQTLSEAATADCTATSEPLRAAYGDAFDAWIAVSHLRFGPIETAERGYALAFWPDSRGATPKALATLIRDADPIVETAEAYSDMSIAARGFYALEFLLYDPTISTAGDDAYRCQLVQTVTADIANLTEDIATDWQDNYAALLTNPSQNSLYRTDAEAAQELFKALNTGLELTSDARLGRPLGTFDQPRPTRAEVWRSGRSARHVAVALDSLRDLATRLSQGDPALVSDVDAVFARAIGQIEALDDPVFAGVATPTDRIKVEALRSRVDEIRAIAGLQIGLHLGVEAGFNSLDGD